MGWSRACATLLKGSAFVSPEVQCAVSDESGCLSIPCARCLTVIDGVRGGGRLPNKLGFVTAIDTVRGPVDFIHRPCLQSVDTLRTPAVPLDPGLQDRSMLCRDSLLIHWT